MSRTAIVALVTSVFVCAQVTAICAQSLPDARTAPADVPPPTAPLPPGMTRIFDGRTLDGWVQEPPNVTSISSGDITDLGGFAKRLKDKSDPVSAFLADELDEATKTALTADERNEKALRSALAKELSRIVAGPSIFDAARFKDVHLRAQAEALLKRDPQGRDLARLNRMLLEDAYPNELWTSPLAEWTVKNGALASLGAGRGVIYTKRSFDAPYRVIFDVRHVSGNPDHRACVLVFCHAPTADEKPLDALGGIQFQVPNGGSWDYRPGKNNNGNGLFTRVGSAKFDEHQWARVELLVNPSTGTARMAVAQLSGARAVEVMDFKDPTAAHAGPFALQMHNRELFDEYTNIAIEVNPSTTDFVTAK